MRDVRAAAPRSGAADVLILLVLVGAVAPLGTVRPGAWVAVLIASLGAWLLATRSPASPMPRVLAWGLGLWGGALVLSLVPLPFSLLEVLSPAAADLRAAGIPGEPSNPGWTPLHLAPGVGALRVLRWAAITAFVGACCARMGSRAFRRALPLAVVASIGLGLLLTAVQTALGARDVLGLFAVRQDVRGSLLTPLVNENHWAALLALGAPVALMLPARLSTRVRSMGVAVGLIAATLVLVGPSRSGVLGLLVAGAAVASMTASRGRGALGGVAALVAVGVGWLFVGGETAVEYADTGRIAEHADPLSKVTALPEVWSLVTEYPLTGVGAGAFVDAFPAHRTASLDDLMVHAENLPLQVLADHGLIVGAALLACLLWGLATCVRRASDPTRVAATAALVGLTVHELADFATQTGVVLLAAGALAAYVLTSRAPVSGARGAHRYAGATVAAVVLLTAPGLRDRDLEATQGRLVAEHLAGEKTWDEVAVAMHRARPASFVAAQEIGVGYARRGDPAALGWMGRAQSLAPHHPSPHLWTARVLRRLGAGDQALGEYRRVLQRNWRYQGRAVVAEVARKYDGDRALVRLAGVEDPILAARISWELFQLRDDRASAVADVADEAAHPFAGLVVARARILGGAPREGAEVARRALAHPDVTPWLRARLVEHIDEAAAMLALLEP